MCDGHWPTHEHVNHASLLHRCTTGTCSSSTPDQDAAVVHAIRRAVGPDVVLRADANRGWDLDQACSWGRLVQPACLQYVEEPTDDILDAPSFYERTRIRFAIDESLDDMAANRGGQQHGGTSQVTGIKEQLCDLHKRSNGGLAAVVLKPSMTGGIERTLAVAETATQLEVQVVVSSSFDSPLGMAGLLELAAAADNMAIAAGREAAQHGLGTTSWFKPDHIPSSYASLTASSLQVQYQHVTHQALQDLPLQPAMQPTVTSWQQHVTTGGLHATLHAISINNQPLRAAEPHIPGTSLQTSLGPAARTVVQIAASPVQEQQQQQQQPAVVFLHGFMGCKEDWLPLMHATAASASVQCVALDLPGHGHTSSTQPASSASYSLEQLAALVASVIQAKGLVGCTLVGYSMGARMAMSVALQHPHLIGQLVCISGTPGLKDTQQAERRAAADAERAALLRHQGMDYFLHYWYSQSMWSSLRSTPGYDDLLQQRAHSSDVKGLADVLTSASTGKMVSMWGGLRGLQVPTLLITGELDEKFNVISKHIIKHVKGSPAGQLVTTVCISGAGHAAHIEKPWPVVEAITRWRQGHQAQ